MSDAAVEGRAGGHLSGAGHQAKAEGQAEAGEENEAHGHELVHILDPFGGLYRKKVLRKI